MEPFPRTYEQLVAQLLREHPGWTREQVIAHIADVVRQQDAPRGGRK